LSSSSGLAVLSAVLSARLRAKLWKCRECRPAGQQRCTPPPMAKSTACCRGQALTGNSLSLQLDLESYAQSKAEKKPELALATSSATNNRRGLRRGGEVDGVPRAALQQERRLDRLRLLRVNRGRAEDLAAWLRKPPNGAAAAAAPGVVASEARRLLSFVGEAFAGTRQPGAPAARPRYGGAGGDGTNAASLWRRRDVGGVGRGNCGTACDQCDSTLFGAYFCCGKCGYALCPDCRLSDPAAAAAAAAASSSDRPATRLRPGGGVAAAGDCTVGARADRLLLATNVPGDAFARLASAVARLRVPPLSPPESPPPPPPPVAADSPADPDAEAAYNRSLILRFSLSAAPGPGCLAFQRHWRRGLPVVVANCLPAAAAAAADAWWHPRSLSRGLTAADAACELRRGTELPPPHPPFWDGFDSMKRRLKNPATGDPLSLRLARPPAGQPFSLPLSELAKAVPFAEYTGAGGRCNLAAGCAPPRLTCAYGIRPGRAAGPRGRSGGRAGAAEGRRLRRTGARPALTPASCAPSPWTPVCPAPLWHVFRPADAAKLRRFLAAGAENGGGNPLAEQTGTYLGPAELDRLRLKCGLRPAVIVQFQGDTVFVPAGAPYQVRNLHSGISLSVDFVSQESCRQCLATGREMRQHKQAAAPQTAVQSRQGRRLSA
uniref:JmjC domain-containing protein n=1 Tax=Macrostomum lignano TaxID=282301 RepID=A0A1I8F8Z2_9PLAT